MSEPARPRSHRIAILGHEVDGAMAAAVLAHGLPKTHSEVIVVPTGTHSPSFGPIEASSPSIRGFHAMLGVAEDEVVGAASGSFALGTAYSGWSGADSSYFAPFGDVGGPLSGVAFHQLAARLRKSGESVRLGNFSVAAMLAQTGRFAHPVDDPRSVLSTYSYGLHVDRHAYAEVLLAVAAKAGATLTKAPFRSIIGANHGIGAIECADGSLVQADIFIDASGSSRLLAEAVESHQIEEWTEWLPCDSLVELECENDVPPAPYALISADGFGWQRTVPARGRVGECLAFASKELSDDEACARVIDKAHGRPVSEARLSRVVPGRLAKPWAANCIAVGSAAGVVEPTGAAPLHLLDNQLRHLLPLFPSNGASDVLRHEFNRLVTQELDRVRDFAILRYKLNRRDGEPVWDRLRAMSAPPELEHKIAEYRRRGRIPMFDGDLFDETDWAVIFDEQGVRPDRYDVLADTIPLEELKSQLTRMHRLMVEAVQRVPSHGEYLTRLGRSAAA